jgi:chemotaxis protein CheD
VAITFWHPQKHLGGLCHFLLPARRLHRVVHEHDEPDGRYGDEALVRLLSEVRKYGAPISDYTVKVFGGGNVLGLPAVKARIGQANVDCALEMLQRQQIPITASDIAGDGYRYLRFDLNSGDVWVRRGHGVVHEMEKVTATRPGRSSNVRNSGGADADAPQGSRS